MAGNTPPGAKPAKKARQPARPRRVPQRTCAACREVRPKRELLRIVRTPQGHVELDATGKKAGRGTYLCARRSCWDLALKKGRLEHELGVSLLAEDRAALEAYRETLPPEPEPASGPARKGKKAAPSEGSAPA
jgi:uncharacterized protein